LIDGQWFLKIPAAAFEHFHPESRQSVERSLNREAPPAGSLHDGTAGPFFVK
jgi:hypothetical protein